MSYGMKKAFKHKDNFGENIEGVEVFVVAQHRRAKNMVPVKIDTAVRTFILVPKDMPKEKVERLKVRYKQQIESRRL